MEALVLLQCVNSRSRDYHKLSNIKNNLGQILPCRASYSAIYIPVILNSHILSEQWVRYLNEHIIQPHCKKHDRHRVHRRTSL